jgi:hypothetical protein
MNQRVIIVIPAYNEENSIYSVLLELRRVAPDYDLVVVNDGSNDNTGKIVTELGDSQITLPCNLGYGRALQTGIKYALNCNYDVIICFDADGQHPADYVTQIVEKLIESGAGLVIGSRYCDGSPYTGPYGRRVGQRVFSYLTRFLIGQRIFDTSSGFKAMSAGACRVIIGGTFLDFHIEALVRLSMFGFKIVEMPITMRDRSFGRSMHSFTSFIEYPLKTLTLTIVAMIDALVARRTK